MIRPAMSATATSRNGHSTNPVGDGSLRREDEEGSETRLRTARSRAGCSRRSPARSSAACPPADLDERDPDYIRESLPRLWLLSSLYFRGEVRGLGNIPEEGPVLLVGNHSGGNLTPDTTVFTLAFSAYFGVERRFYQLAHNLVLSMPGLGFLRKFGTVAASPANAEKALRSGAAVLVYPGGDHEVHRPTLARAPRRLRRAPRLHPPRARARRADRPGRLHRRPGDRAVPQPRRDAVQAAGPRSAAAPEGAADLDRRCRGASTSATSSATSRCRPRSRSRRCRPSACATSSAPSPTSTRPTSTSCASCRRPSTRSPPSAGCR